MRSGAEEYAHFSLVASSIYFQATVPFIGSSGMFQISEGYLVKDYLEAEDRLQIDIHGDLEMSALNMSISTYNMNSAANYGWDDRVGFNTQASASKHTLPISQLKYPEWNAYAADASGHRINRMGGTWLPDTYIPTASNYISFPHSHNTNVLFISGRVEAISWSRMRGKGPYHTPFGNDLFYYIYKGRS